jgi:hypothetical protein
MDSSSNYSVNDKEASIANAAYKEKLNSLLKQAGSAIGQLYSTSSKAYEDGYAQGRQDAFEEVFKWFTFHHDNSLRNVSVVNFFNFINDKLISTNSKFAQGTVVELTKNLRLEAQDDNNMSDGTSRQIGNLSRILGRDESPGASSNYSSSSQLISRIGMNLRNINLYDNRKRRKDSQNSREAIDHDESSSTLPFSLRPENQRNVPNPFIQEKEDESTFVYLPKRKKLRQFDFPSSSNK